MSPSMKRKKHPLFRRYLFLLSAFLLCTIFGAFYLRFVDYENRPFQVLADDTITDFLVNTPGCQIPSFDPWDPSVRSYFEAVPGPYKCPGDPSFLQIKANAVVSLDATFLNLYYEIQRENISCIFQPIIRDPGGTDETVDSHYKFGDSRLLEFDVPLEDEFIKTECTVTTVSGIRTFSEYIPLTPLKPDVENRCIRAEKKKSTLKERLNVIFLGIDSISRLNFIRHFSKTNKYLSEHLHPFDLEGYTKVGDNTFPNLVPLLTGHFYQYYWNETTNRTMFFDDLDFIWKEFAKYGYRTLLAEDAPDIATFNYLRNGFRQPPTNYYIRPFALAVEESDMKKESKSQCFREKMEMEVILNYLKSFVQTMGKKRNFFAFVFLARLTHDVLNWAGYADEPTFRLLRFLDESGVLNNSVMVLFSDHGIRFGGIRKTYIGQFEERMPFMNLIFPKWFLKTYPKLVANLKRNKKRLTTPFDIHATIASLLHLDAEPIDKAALTNPGISLFREISPHRTCFHAAISSHWCTCQIHKPLPVNDKSVVAASKTIIQTINQLTSPLRDQCAVLVLSNILQARVARTESRMQIANSKIHFTTVDTANFNKEVPNFVEYLIVVSAAPSDALFEATVRCEKRTGTCVIIDDISRINKYGEQSSCIEDAILRKFCYCL